MDSGVMQLFVKKRFSLKQEIKGSLALCEYCNNMAYCVMDIVLNTWLCVINKLILS